MIYQIQSKWSFIINFDRIFIVTPTWSAFDCSTDRWQESLGRFRHIFNLNMLQKTSNIKVYYISGNHDIGYAALISRKPEVHHSLLRCSYGFLYMWFMIVMHERIWAMQFDVTVHLVLPFNKLPIQKSYRFWFLVRLFFWLWSNSFFLMNCLKLLLCDKL